MEIKFRKLQKSDLPQIASLEEYLWGLDVDYRKQMLHWKYESVPEYKYLGAIAVQDDTIVGFRGLVSSKWISSKNEISVVYFTDAVVHPEFRGKNLLSKLNQFLEETYKDHFDFIMVLFPNKVSGHIYKNQQILPFMRVNFFYRKFILNRNKKVVDFVNVKNIDEVLMLIDESYLKRENTIRLKYDRDYLDWKLNEPNKVFKTIKSTVDSSVFIVFEEKKKNLEILFIPYLQLENSLDLVESYAINTKKLYINLPVSENVNNDIKRIISNKGFRKYTVANKLKSNFFEQKEILIRPFDLSVQETPVNSLVKDPCSWEYQHLIYV